MDQNFRQLTDQLPSLLKSLEKCPKQIGKPKRELSLPARAVYLFSQNGEHLYVGRTNRLRARIREHLTGRNNDAPFAFKIARHETGYFKGKGQPTRRELELLPEFSDAFSNAKKRLREMEWRFVEVREPNLQCLFEIYATLSMDAQFNDFENH